MKTSLIVTVYNEEKTILSLLTSITKQTVSPNEVIIIDGGSKDKTVQTINAFAHKNKNLQFYVYKKIGNRSVGRNEAVRKAKGELILCTDAGCELDKNWVKEMINSFTKDIDVVAGYYKGNAVNIFQYALIPYVLVMPDKVNKNEFLPASRSMAFTKKIWKKVGGFPEVYSHNEDYVFANELKNKNAKILFQKKAIVNWYPRNTIRDAFVMFFRFAFGDAEANLLRNKVLLLFIRYFFFLYLFCVSVLMKSLFLASMLFVGVLLYLLWAVIKNYKYLEKKKAFLYLPILQVISDISVIIGTCLGVLKNIVEINYIRIVKRHKVESAIIIFYTLHLLLTINWGLPNKNHPFTYFMDEWHQSQAVHSVFTQGTPNVEGSANGTMFHFFVSGIFLIPFIVLGILDPFVINSSVTEFLTQQRLFQLLRLSTLLYGIASILLFSYIIKKYFSINARFPVFLLVVNPIWLMLSNYFKYDIALVFWILLSFLFFLKYAFDRSIRSFYIAAFISGIAISVKVSGVALLPVLFLLFFLYNEKPLKNTIHLCAGISIFSLTFLLLGIPDILFGNVGSLYEYLDSNLNRSPALSNNYMLGMHYGEFLLFHNYPLIFGHCLYYVFLLSIFFFIIHTISKLLHFSRKDFLFLIRKQYPHIVLFLLFISFASSLFPLKIGAISNRVLVLLPFITLYVTFFINSTYKNTVFNKIKLVLLLLLLVFQTLESTIWIQMKLSTDPRVAASNWIKQNIVENTTIGLENIPIYQFLPDIVLKEFYEKQYGIKKKYKYNYQIIDTKSKHFPRFVIVTNNEIEKKYFHSTPKKHLVRIIEEQGYKPIKEFTPNFTYYKLIGNELEYYMSGLILAPNTITIYKK